MSPSPPSGRSDEAQSTASIDEEVSFCSEWPRVINMEHGMSSYEQTIINATTSYLKNIFIRLLKITLSQLLLSYLSLH